MGTRWNVQPTDGGDHGLGIAWLLPGPIKSQGSDLVMFFYVDAPQQTQLLVVIVPYQALVRCGFIRPIASFRHRAEIHSSLAWSRREREMDWVGTRSTSTKSLAPDEYRDKVVGRNGDE